VDYIPRHRRNYRSICDIPGRQHSLANLLTEDSVHISSVVEGFLLRQPAISESDACHLTYLANNLQRHANAANRLHADLGCNASDLQCHSHDCSPRPLRRRRTASSPLAPRA
jgi:hypothetical protein